MCSQQGPGEGSALCPVPAPTPPPRPPVHHLLYNLEALGASLGYQKARW